MENKNIYDLKLHEETLISGYRILRVPGGWIYDKWDYKKENYLFDPIFIPFNNEFKIDKMDF